MMHGMTGTAEMMRPFAEKILPDGWTLIVPEARYNHPVRGLTWWRYEDYDADAIEAFIELYGEEELENFSDAYQGEMSGAEFAEQLVTDCYCLDIPAFVCVDWEATWNQLCYDYDEQDGYIFSRHF